MSGKYSGALVVSLDTELVWGMFDMGATDPGRYTGTREVIRSLLDLFDKYQVPATWALVTHLLTDCCTSESDKRQYLNSCGQNNRDVVLPCQQELDPNLWYEPQIINWIENTNVDHDIGSHTHTHLVFNEASHNDARREIEQSLSIAKRCGIEMASFVYPRNRIAHRDVLSDAGFEVYRGTTNRWYERAQLPTSVVKGARFADEAAQWTPPMVTPSTESGLVEVPGSQVFRPFHGGWQYTPKGSQRSRAIAGLDRAAQTGRIFHIWFHPFNFTQDPKRLLTAFEAILAHAQSLVREERLEVLTMRDVAELYREGRWTDLEPDR